MPEHIEKSDIYKWAAEGEEATRNRLLDTSASDPAYAVCMSEMNVWTRLKPRTNSDNIRQASDEELAVLLQNSCCRPDLMDCPQIDDCVDCWLDWLKQEVECDDGV